MLTCVVAAGSRPANVIADEFIEGQVAKAPAGRLNPGARFVTAQIGVQTKIMVHDDLPVARQMHIEFRAVGAERNRVREGAQRIFRRKCCAAAMGKDQRRHQE